VGVKRFPIPCRERRHRDRFGVELLLVEDWEVGFGNGAEEDELGHSMSMTSSLSVAIFRSLQQSSCIMQMTITPMPTRNQLATHKSKIWQMENGRLFR